MPSGMNVESNQNALNLLLLNLDRLDKLFSQATVKASLIISANAILLALLLGDHESYLQPLASSGWFSIPVIALVGIAVSSAISITFSILVVKAFLGSGEQKGEYQSLIYFGHVSQFDLSTYIDKATNITEEQLIDDLARQVHLLSQSLEKKFRYVNRSIVFLAVALGQAVLIAVIHALIVH